MRLPIRRLLLLAWLPACTERAPPPPLPAAEPEPPGSFLEIRFLDVGQGDAVLLREGGRTVLIDAGPADRVVARLRELRVDSIDLMIASHNHADHIGGMDAVLDSFPVLAFLDNGHPTTTRIQERVLERVEAEEATYLQAAPRTISLGAARLRVLSTPREVEGDEQNNRSIPVVVEYGSFRALLTGDSELELLNALLASSSPPDVDVMKAPHHGSRNGVTPAWLARTRPEVVVISAGEGNAYGHPHEAALRYYCAGRRKVYRTDLQGEVVVEVRLDGTYEVRTEREGVAC